MPAFTQKSRNSFQGV